VLKQRPFPKQGSFVLTIIGTMASSDFSQDIAMVFAYRLIPRLTCLIFTHDPVRPLLFHPSLS